MCYCCPASLLQLGFILSPGISTEADAHHLSALMMPTVLLSLGFILSLITGGRLILLPCYIL
jgi:hypothetical protein